VLFGRAIVAREVARYQKVVLCGDANRDIAQRLADGPDLLRARPDLAYVSGVTAAGEC
jgi:hypothetical protein